MRLKSSKCTIGSGPRCTLRLRAGGVAPLHCLILRGPATTVVRRWAADTRLNYESFTDATLLPGDRLSLGPIELEVLSVGIVPTTVQPPQEAEKPLNSPNEPNLLADVERQSLDQQRAAVSAEQSELEIQRTALADERQQWESQRDEAVAQEVARTDQFDARLAELESERRAFQQQREQWQTEQTEAKRQLDEQRQDLAARLSELDAQRGVLDEERHQWEARRNELATATQQPAIAKEPQEPALSEPQFQAPPDKAPVDLADVFRRIGANIEMEEDKPALDESAQPVRRPLDRTSQLSAAAATETGDEESINDYMNRLMQRVRSTSGELAPASFTPPRAEAAQLSHETPAPVAEPSLPAAELRESAEMSPRTVAPENRIDLSALRELANLSAHSAISRHSRQVLIHTMYSKLAVAAVALVVGGVLLWMWKSPGALQMTFYSALVALLVAIYWGVEYALLTGRLIISKSGHIDIDWNASPVGQAATQPPRSPPSKPILRRGGRTVERRRLRSRQRL